MNPLSAIGRPVLDFFAVVGRFVIFFGDAVASCIRPPIYLPQVARQLTFIGYNSLPVVGLTALFTGMVLALQSYTGFARFNAESTIATVVVLSITRELGPVLAGLMVSGRVGAAIAAELGTMRVTEQIDAMKTLSVSPMQYLVAPRILAGIIAMPILVLIADIIGVFGGFVIGVYTLDFNAGSYIKRTWQFLELSDVLSGLAKAAVFGLIITLTGCYQGYMADRGAQGVGRATTNAVVASAVLIFVANYFLTQIFFAR